MQNIRKRRYFLLLYKHQCFTGLSATEKSHIFSHVKIRYFYVQKISANPKSSFGLLYIVN